jgi:hypothetical protein
MAHVSASESAIEAATHASRSKRMRNHCRAKYDDGQKDHCIAHVLRLPRALIAKLNGDYVSTGCLS